MQPAKVERGQHWFDKRGRIRVMTVADGYVMVRRPRCIPYVISESDLRAGYTFEYFRETKRRATRHNVDIVTS